MILTIIFSVLILVVVGVGMILWLHPAFGRAPRGERLERISASPNYRNGQFFNIEKNARDNLRQGGSPRSVGRYV